jgi:hypothetical protein
MNGIKQRQKIPKHKSGRKAALIAKAEEGLLFAVRLDVVFRRMFRVLGGMNVVAVRQVRVVSGLRVVTACVVLGGFMVMARSVFMVLGCLRVVISCFVRHVQPPDDLKTGLLKPRRIIESQLEGRR